MRQSVIDLENFYDSRLGLAAQSMVARRLDSVWPDLSGRDILGYGYCYPFLAPYLGDAKRMVLAMPGGQGAIAQRGRRGVMACLVEEQTLPFPDACFDNVIVAHGFEEASDLPIFAAGIVARHQTGRPDRGHCIKSGRPVGQIG